MDQPNTGGKALASAGHASSSFAYDNSFRSLGYLHGSKNILGNLEVCPTYLPSF